MNGETRTQHLTDAEFSLLLDGAQPGASAAAHLANCEYCSQELEVVQSSVGSFHALSTTWAEREAPRRVPVPARWAAGFGLQNSWGAGLAATAITGVLAFWLGMPGQPAARPVLTGTPAVAPTNADLAADNHLLTSIDQELSDQGQSLLAAAELRSEGHHDLHRALGSLSD